ncbi:MHYT domain-containing protein [Streptomyces sp. NPDC003247]|uniref:MHYT domain-containing protein n=1 Tax=Streptomyces sp. NPDC003247 TaxID=3364677 RepID=UPI00367DD13C
MSGSTGGFSYGVVTPVAAFLVACLGAALGLRCVVRTMHHHQGWKPGWLALGAASLGCGIWTMHFIGMLGFSVVGGSLTYDAPTTLLSLLVAVVVVSVGIFIVGYRGVAPVTLGTAGAITGLGVAAMHYLGMSAVQVNGEITYDTTTVALSVVIAVVAATAALWAAVSIRGFLPSLGASVVMGLAVCGMHYTGIAAVHVHLHPGTATGQGGSPAALLLPMLAGPGMFLILATVVVMFDPLLVTGGDWKDRGSAPHESAEPLTPARTSATPENDWAFTHST